MNINNVGVVGCGLRGAGIVETCARAGYAVTVREISTELLQQGLDRVKKSMEKAVSRGKLTQEDMDAALARIEGTIDLTSLAGSDLAIEAVVENMALKKEVFATLDELCAPEVILASNTSSISITRLAAATKRPGQVIGMHFFNPVPLMALVELINGLQTSAGTYAEVEALAKSIGKTPIKVKNSPGFVVNRMLCPMINEAVFALGEGLATAAEIDEAMKLGCNHPIGPLALCDLIGLDVELAVMQVLYEGTKDPKYRPAPLLVEMLEAGYLGRKSGKGFFEYPAK